MADDFEEKSGQEKIPKEKPSIIEKLKSKHGEKHSQDTRQNSEKINPELLKKEEEIKTLMAKISEIENREKRTMADFINFRQRMQNEKTNAYDNGMIDAITKLLTILDNLDRALQSVPNEEKENNYYKGTEMIAKQFLVLLSELGVEEIKVKPGDNFNHEFHDAMAHIEDENFGENQIVDVFEKGYKFKNKVIRYAKVRVAN